jgi:hypothetical protein
MGGAGSGCLFLRVSLCALVVYVFIPGCFCPQITRIVQIFTAKARNVHEGRSREQLFIPSCTIVRLGGLNFWSWLFLSADYTDCADFYGKGEECVRRAGQGAVVYSFVYHYAPSWFIFWFRLFLSADYADFVDFYSKGEECPRRAEQGAVVYSFVYHCAPWWFKFLVLVVPLIRWFRVIKAPV